MLLQTRIFNAIDSYVSCVPCFNVRFQSVMDRFIKNHFLAKTKTNILGIFG